MQFMFGCLAVIVIAVSLFVSSEHARQSDVPFIHWILGFFACGLSVLLAVLGIWW